MDDFIVQIKEILYGKENIDNHNMIVEIDRLIQKYIQYYPFIKYEYAGFEALNYLLHKFNFRSVLDIGSGQGLQSKAFVNAGKQVTAIDYDLSGRTNDLCTYKDEKFRQIIGDFNTYIFEEKYDLVWVCHVLEHQLNPHLFLKKVISCVDEGGLIAITVPPYKSEIVGGHVSIWNAGLLIYNLILAGVDCKNAHIKKYGYNISIIVEKKTIDVKNEITYDCGDLRRLKKYFPSAICWYDEGLGRDINFDGNIENLNWI